MKNCQSLDMKVPQETHDRVVTIVNETLAKAKTLWPSHAHLILPLSVDWDVGGVRTAGLARIGRNRVSFNYHYINEADFWNTTVPHEVAHHIQKWLYPRARQAHGPEFRSIMARLGCSTRTRHSMAPEALKEFKPHEYECPCCKKTFNLSNIIHNRIQSGQRRFCASPACKPYQKRNPLFSHIQLKGQVKTKEVGIEKIIRVDIPTERVEVKINLVTPPTQTVPVVEKKVVGPARLSDIISKGWWNS